MFETFSGEHFSDHVALLSELRNILPDPIKQDAGDIIEIVKASSAVEGGMRNLDILGKSDAEKVQHPSCADELNQHQREQIALKTALMKKAKSFETVKNVAKQLLKSSEEKTKLVNDAMAFTKALDLEKHTHELSKDIEEDQVVNAWDVGMLDMRNKDWAQIKTLFDKSLSGFDSDAYLKQAMRLRKVWTI